MSTSQETGGAVPPIRAAGGLVWRRVAGERVLAVIHRSRYDDWTLPKGKLDPGESFEEAAVREVREETGVSARITALAGELHYEVDGHPKVVRYYHMEAADTSGAVQDVDEVDELVWLGVDEARARLVYDSERSLLPPSP